MANASEPWPCGDGIDQRPEPDALDRAKLDAVVESAFVDPDPELSRNTRAVLVIRDGPIVGERHAEGFAAAVLAALPN